MHMFASKLRFQANAVADENQGNRKVVLNSSTLSLNDEKKVHLF